MNPILLAAQVCRKAHAGQVRKYTGDPYWTHPARVASRVSLLPNATEEMVCAAYLHDVLEDTEMTLDDLNELFRYLDYDFRKVMLGYVRDLTDVYTTTAYPKANRKQRKELERIRIAACPPEVINIKLCDIIDNLRGQDPSDPFARVFLQEKGELLTMVSDKAAEELLIEVMQAGTALKELGQKLAPKYWRD